MSKILKLPVWWYCVIAASFLAGLLFMYLGGSVGRLKLEPLQPPSVKVNWLRLCGVYLMAIPATHLTIYVILAGVRRLFALRPLDQNPQHLWPPALIGVAEAIMYPTAFLVGKPEFAGLWIAFKVAGQWGWWTVERAPEGILHTGKLDESHEGKNAPTAVGLEESHEGRRRYYQSLLGNALSLWCGGATYLAILLLASK